MDKRHFGKLLSFIANSRPNKDFFKFLANSFRQLSVDKFKGTTEVPYPTTIMLELANLCNLRCTTCARVQKDGEDMELGIMKEEQAYKIVDEVYPYLASIGLTGMGETFLNPHVLNVAKYIKSKKKSIIISASTNANFPKALDNILPAFSVIDTLQISIDGIGEVYDKIRIGGKFDSFVSNLDAIVSAKPKNLDITLNMVITQENYHQMADMVEFVSAHGVRFLSLTYYNLVCSSRDVSYYDFFSSEEFLREKGRAEAAIKAHPEVEVTGLDFPGNPSFQKCPFMWNHFYITWDGYMVPCCGKPFPKRYNFGNVFGKDVMSVINSEKFQAFRRAWQENNSPKFCEKCHFVCL